MNIIYQTQGHTFTAEVVLGENGNTTRKTVEKLRENEKDNRVCREQCLPQGQWPPNSFQNSPLPSFYATISSNTHPLAPVILKSSSPPILA